MTMNRRPVNRRPLSGYAARYDEQASDCRFSFKRSVRQLTVKGNAHGPGSDKVHYGKQAHFRQPDAFLVSQHQGREASGCGDGQISQSMSVQRPFDLPALGHASAVASGPGPLSGLQSSCAVRSGLVSSFGPSSILLFSTNSYVQLAQVHPSSSCGFPSKSPAPPKGERQCPLAREKPCAPCRSGIENERMPSPEPPISIFQIARDLVKSEYHSCIRVAQPGPALPPPVVAHRVCSCS